MSVENEVRNDKKAVIDTSEIGPPEGDTQSKEDVTSAFVRVVVVLLLLMIFCRDNDINYEVSPGGGRKCTVSVRQTHP